MCLLHGNRRFRRFPVPIKAKALQIMQGGHAVLPVDYSASRH